MHNLGDTVWRATVKRSQVHVACPDCFGRRALRVILGDDSEVVIDCSTCAAGYDPPRGYVTQDVHAPQSHVCVISKVETELVNGEVVTLYSGDGFYRLTENDLFRTGDEADARAQTLSAEQDAEAVARMKRKEKDGQTWAWHVTYHRRCMKQAQRDLTYHTSKLEVALLKRKDNADALKHELSLKELPEGIQ